MALQRDHDQISLSRHKTKTRLMCLIVFCQIGVAYAARRHQLLTSKRCYFGMLEAIKSLDHAVD